MMSVHPWEIEAACESVAQVTSLGERYVHTTHPTLRILDGEIFASLEVAREAVFAALDRGSTKSQSAA